MTNLYFNKSKNIGSVIYIVEGDVTESQLITHIFKNILDYTVVNYDKRSDKFIILQGKNKYSQVSIIPSKYPQIKMISNLDNQKYLTDVFYKLISTYGLNENSAKFYIFDRDRSSNRPSAIKQYLKLANPYDNGSEMSGQFLLSYPCIEAFLLMANNDKSEFGIGGKLKQFIHNKHYEIGNIGENEILNITKSMIRIIEEFVGKPFDINIVDNFSQINELIFNKEDAYWNKNKVYKTLSLICISLLSLGILCIE